MRDARVFNNNSEISMRKAGSWNGYNNWVSRQWKAATSVADLMWDWPPAGQHLSFACSFILIFSQGLGWADAWRNRIVQEQHRDPSRVQHQQHQTQKFVWELCRWNQILLGI